MKMRSSCPFSHRERLKAGKGYHGCQGMPLFLSNCTNIRGSNEKLPLLEKAPML